MVENNWWCDAYWLSHSPEKHVTTQSLLEDKDQDDDQLPTINDILVDPFWEGDGYSSSKDEYDLNIDSKRIK